MRRRPLALDRLGPDLHRGGDGARRRRRRAARLRRQPRAAVRARRAAQGRHAERRAPRRRQRGPRGRLPRSARSRRSSRCRAAAAGAQLTLSLDTSATPIPDDSTIRIRPALGARPEVRRARPRLVATRAAPTARRSPRAPDAVGPELDDFFSTFDEPTRKNVDRNLDYFGTALAGRGTAINRSLGALPELLRRPAAGHAHAGRPRHAARAPRRARPATRRGSSRRVGDVLARGFTVDGRHVRGAVARPAGAARTRSRARRRRSTRASARCPRPRPFLARLAGLSDEVQGTARELRASLPDGQQRARRRHARARAHARVHRRPRRHAARAARPRALADDRPDARRPDRHDADAEPDAALRSGRTSRSATTSRTTWTFLVRPPRRGGRDRHRPAHPGQARAARAAERRCDASARSGRRTAARSTPSSTRSFGDVVEPRTSRLRRARSTSRATPTARSASAATRRRPACCAATPTRTPGNQGPTYTGRARVPDGPVLLRRADRDRSLGAAMNRDRGPSAFAVGATLLVLALLVTYLGFTKDIPFVNEPYEIKAAFRDTARHQAALAGADRGRRGRRGARPSSTRARARSRRPSRWRSATPAGRSAPTRRAKIRPRIFLEGNFFVDLQPGLARARRARRRRDDRRSSRTTTPVQFDQVLGALKSDTRNDLKRRLHGGRARRRTTAARRRSTTSLRYQPAAYKFSAIVSEALLGEQPGDLGDWVRDQGVVAGALDADPAQLRGARRATSTRPPRALADRESVADAQPSASCRGTLRAAPPALDELQRRVPRRAPLRRAARARACARSARPSTRRCRSSSSCAASSGRPSCAASRATCARRRRRSRASRAAAPGAARRSCAPLSSCANEVLVPFGNDKLERQGVPGDRPGLPGAAEVPARAWPARAARSTPTARGSRSWARAAPRRSTSATGCSARRSSRSSATTRRRSARARRCGPTCRARRRSRPDLRSNPRGAPRGDRQRERHARPREAKAQASAVASCARS